MIFLDSKIPNYFTQNKEEEEKLSFHFIFIRLCISKLGQNFIITLKEEILDCNRIFSIL